MNTVLLHLCIVGKDVLDWNQTSDTKHLLVGFFDCYEWNIPYFMNEHQQQQRIICMPETHPRTHGSKFKLRPKTAANVKTSPIHTQHNMTSNVRGPSQKCIVNMKCSVFWTSSWQTCTQQALLSPSRHTSDWGQLYKSALWRCFDTRENHCAQLQPHAFQINFRLHLHIQKWNRLLP